MQLTVTSVLQVLMALGSFVTLIRELMTVAQAEFGKGTGPDKAAAVLAGVEAVVSNSEVWDKVKGMFALIINCIAFFKPKTINIQG